MSIAKLPPGALRLSVDPTRLGFADTAELIAQPLPWIGQERAQEAARFGLQMAQPDYNLFVLGELGCGRSSLMRELMHRAARMRPVPPDLCYLHNFELPERPLALRLDPGQGRLFRQLLADLAKRLQTEIPKRLAAPDIASECERVRQACRTEEDRAFAALSAFAESRNFGLLRERGNLVFTQRDEAGEPLTAERALKLPPEQRMRLDAAEGELRAEIARFLDDARPRELAMDQALAALRRRCIKPLLDERLQALRQQLNDKVRDPDKLGQYLDRMQDELLEQLDLFQAANRQEEDHEAELLALLSRLRVNVVVDNHGRDGAPVIVDENPLFRSLFGCIEYESEDGALVTDFSLIRAGSLLKAHGGFLMLHLRDLLADGLVHEKLRRFLRSGRLDIEEPGLVQAPLSAVSLQPEPVEVQVKIVLIASVEEYYLVQDADPEFARRFRCKVDFAESFRATPDTHRGTAIFVAHLCRSLRLPHFSAAAVAAVIEEMHRDAEDQTRQSAIFAKAEALVIESAEAARARGSAPVEVADVRAAIEARWRRHGYPEQRLQESIADGERLLTVSGERTGQVNGLTVLDMGDCQFGFPVRVSAATHAGEEGLLDIEREVEMAGPVHSKGVLILHSYLSSLFAHIAPLALNAAVVFEQEYSGIEGDSASCAEFYALLSALSGLPLRQDIAVTGALNQHGEMLPVGAINEKIEGFFRSCQGAGLDGQQGVLIPQRNRANLMLAPALVEAVAAGCFHIYTAEHVGEGMELLTRRAFGVLGPGGYARDTVLGQAQLTLHRYRDACDRRAPAGAKDRAHPSEWPPRRRRT